MQNRYICQGLFVYCGFFIRFSKIFLSIFKQKTKASVTTMILFDAMICATRYERTQMSSDMHIGNNSSENFSVGRVGGIKDTSSGKNKDNAGVPTLAKAALVVAVMVLICSIVLFIHARAPGYGTDEIGSFDTPQENINQTTSDMSIDSRIMDASATIEFPDGVSFTITALEAGFSPGAGVVTGEINLPDASDIGFNENYVHEVVAVNTKRFNDALIDGACDIHADRIIITKGSSVEPADETEVYELTVSTLYRAVDEQTHLSAEFIPNKSETKDLDLLMLYDRIFVEPVSAVYDAETNGVTESVMGVRFNINEAQALMDRAALGAEVFIPLIRTMPEVTSYQLERMLFRDVISERTTRIDGTSNRLNNVVLSSAAIDGTILAPGDVFSFNGIVGQRTAESGYKEAGAYINNETVQEIGGGICQTSSTIYDCVLHADLKVIERLNHMFTVAYLPLGNDATINWGTIDLKFENNTEFPIMIEATVNGRNLTVRFIGTKLDDNYIKISYKQVSVTPYDIITQVDESVPQGTTVVKTGGFTGVVVDTYKSLYDKDDNLLSETLVGRSSYRAQNRVILIPPELDELDEDATEPPPETDVDELMHETPQCEPGETGEAEEQSGLAEQGEQGEPGETGEQSEPGNSEGFDVGAGEAEPTETHPGETEPTP